MPVIQQHDRFNSLYFVSLASLETALGITTPVREWDWEGVGLNGWIVARWNPMDILGNPRAGVTKRVFSETLYLFRDVRDAFLTGIPDAKFIKMTVTYDETNAYFNLNLDQFEA